MSTSYQFFSYSYPALMQLVSGPTDEQLEDIAEAYMDLFSPGDEEEDEELQYANLVKKIKSVLKKDNIREVYHMEDNVFLNEVMISLMETEAIDAEEEYDEDTPQFKYVNTFIKDVKDKYKLNHSLIFLSLKPDDAVYFSPEKTKQIFEELKPVCESSEVRKKYRSINDQMFKVLKNIVEKDKALAFVIG